MSAAKFRLDGKTAVVTGAGSGIGLAIARAFAAAGAIDRLEGFACRFGPGFYGLPVNTERVRLVDEAWTVPESYPLGAEELIPLRAGETIGWRLV